MKKIAIIQSCYIPWKGYFDIINSVDEFIIYDDVQFTKRDWRNRNKIKTANGVVWLTIPVETKNKYFQKIKETSINDDKWFEKHWKTIETYYKKAPFFEEYSEIFKKTYYECKDASLLSGVNYRFIKLICRLLGIKTKISWSTDYDCDITDKTMRLIELCKKAGSTHYVSGPSAKNYINTDIFVENQITLEYFDYSGYKEYPQLWGDFVHEVSIIDLILNTGKDAKRYMRSFNQ